jgi:hypothetical protein
MVFPPPSRAVEARVSVVFARLVRPVVDEEEGFDVNNDEAILKSGS